MSLQQEVELLRNTPLFANIEASKLKLIAFTAERLKYQAGDVLFNQGEIGDAAYIIMNGEADVLVNAPDGPLCVATLKTNDIVGEIAILCDVPRTATVQAKSDLTTLCISKDLFFRLVCEFPQIAVELMRELAHRVEETTGKLRQATANGWGADGPMSRLDSAIRRPQAQRSCLNAACDLIGEVPGIVLELGLGNGRTYDHLRELMPDREIFVFERQIAAHPDCIPDDAHLFLGDLGETLPPAVQRFAGTVALVHSDIGTGDGGYNAEIAAFLSGALGPVLAPGALVVSDQRIAIAGCAPVDPPADIQQDRYFMLRKG